MEDKIKELCKQPTHIICIYNDVHTKLIRAFVGSCHFTGSAAPSLIDGVDGAHHLSVDEQYSGGPHFFHPNKSPTSLIVWM